MNKVESLRKNILPRIILSLIIFVSILSQVNFFRHDLRPFLDHDHYYFLYNYDGLLYWLYPFFNKTLSNLFSPIAIYKLINLTYIIPLIIVSYLIGKTTHNKIVGLLAAFFVTTFPMMLNLFRKSEINLKLTMVFAMALYLYIKLTSTDKKRYGILFIATLWYMLTIHHSSFILIVILFVSLCIQKYKQFFTRSLKNPLMIISLFLIISGISLLFCKNLFEFHSFAFHSYLINNRSLGEICSIAPILDMISRIRNDASFHLDIYFYLSLICVLFFTYQTLHRKKLIGIEGNYLLILSLNFLIVSFVPIPTKQKFIMPNYVILAQIIAITIATIYNKLSTKKTLLAIFTTLILFILTYGIILLFSPALLIKKTDESLNYYYPVKDNFNMPEHISLFNQLYAKGLDITKASIYEKKEDTFEEITLNGGLYLFSTCFLTEHFDLNQLKILNSKMPQLVLYITHTDEFNSQVKQQIDQHIQHTYPSGAYTFQKSLDYGKSFQNNREYKIFIFSKGE